MFTTLGFEVEELHRHSIGGLTLGELPEGEWRFATPEDLEAVFSGAEVVLDAPTSNSSSSSSRVGGSAGASTSGLHSSSSSSSNREQQRSSRRGSQDAAKLPRTEKAPGASDRAAAVAAGVPGQSWAAAGLPGEELVLDEDEEAFDEDGSLREEQSSTSKRYRDSLRFKRRRTQLRQRVLKGSPASQ